MTIRARSATRADIPRVLALMQRHPVTHCFAADRLRGITLGPPLSPRDLLVTEESGTIRSAVLVGANLVPVGTVEADRTPLVAQLTRQGRRSSSIVGVSSEVLAMWASLEPVWGPAREVRPRQPLLAISGPPAVRPDPGVRRVRPSELDLLLPACVAMFTEEVGVSPVEGHAGPAYRERVRQIISAGHAFARIEQGRVVFKAEVGALAGDVAQIHGVWVHPESRGRGLAAPGMAAVVSALLDEVRTVSLYVNDFNEPALRAYRRAGLHRVGEYSTVLF